MRVVVDLLNARGARIFSKEVEYKEWSCWSDVAQQAPKRYVNYAGEIFTFKRLAERNTVVYQERRALCV